MKKQEVLAKINEILDKISANEIGAWIHNLSETTSAIVIADHEQQEGDIVKYNGWLEDLTNLKKELEKEEFIYYLFGEDAVEEYNENGIDGVVKRYEADTLTYSMFKFQNGVTHPAELLYEFSGWGDYMLISEEEFNKL